MKPNPTVIKKINISENQQNGDIESNTKNQISYHIHDNNEQNVTIEPNEKVDNNKTESDKESYEYEYESSQKEDNSVPPEYYENPNLMNKQIEINKNNLLEPLKLGTNAVFYIHVDPKNPKFVSSLENPEKEICKISRDGKMGSFSYKIILDDQVIATTTSNFSHNTFISVSDKNEISAVTFQKQDKQLKIKQFQAFIPAPGTSVPASDSSLLLKGDVAKIEMGPRPPKLKAGIPVLYFGGRVKKESVKNFILETHDDGCARLVFGKAADNRYVGEIYPPLTPLQAITIALSHFK
ncbi:hypothetical protein TRFO_42143 [Tritrichomonas foetus]|uniref:Tubby C-terminal domain-containing protein n=1 Tax=Tritrichomonas foetus TaxID=1144522 RepID=A0A1J4KXL1_9EUKA|nr:hypothetical protein TRFO_42143 [Tritrichomonas foetus]|eukprot:OHT15987.1 hypothetical protein TRFO_42143 [Tritrichomonas foetus]